MRAGKASARNFQRGSTGRASQAMPGFVEPVIPLRNTAMKWNRWFFLRNYFSLADVPGFAYLTGH
jgi:hypothetical protein